MRNAGSFLNLHLGRHAHGQHVESAPQLAQAGHVPSAHQLRALGHDRVHLHARDGHHRVALGVKRRELALVGFPLQHQVIPPVGRVPTVAQLRAECGPEDRDERFRFDGGRGDAARNAAARVLGHVPVLDAGWGAGAAGAVIGVGGNVADGVDVWEVRNAKRFIRAEGAIFFQGDGGIRFEKFRCRGDADTQDDEVCGERSAVFKVHGTHFGRGRGRRLGAVNGSGHVELHAGFGEGGLEDLAHFGPHDAFEGSAFHAND